MSKYFIERRMAEPLWWFPLDQPINEVSCFQGPIFRYLMPPNQRLSCYYFFSDLLSWPTLERSLSEHQFMSNDAECKVVNWVSMILATEDLRRHISWSSTGVTTIVRSEGSSNTKISDMSKTFAIQDYIFRFYITMDDSLLMEIF